MKIFRAKYPSLLSFLYPKRISRIDNTGSVYLTFDDGPVPEVTPWVLDLLAQYDAKATFFCIGENISKSPEIFKRIITEGHQIGNHTYNHLNGWSTSKKVYMDNIKQTERTFRIETGLSDNTLSTPIFKLFRPPYGKIKNSQARLVKNLGYEIVMWDVISGDYDQSFSPEKCYKNVMKNVRGGSTIVFHDSQKAFPNLEKILPQILEDLKNKGFKFRSLKDAL
ncbi:polysaccharide deacetylase family protein [Christiangramia salexigens]|uniref:Polysaccharide deacetylase family protein n=1 Tax=Christiangramia salexigens TaxID=1913577 RepID=A0A1L3J5Q2_9FLAO|nr:polysaccharide deacetylase family protein [Christiangramia salexigens]APG60442.1 polysaccharide deacetylase family protein [Christiangramia salexigens]